MCLLVDLAVAHRRGELVELFIDRTCHVRRGLRGVPSGVLVDAPFAALSACPATG